MTSPDGVPTGTEGRQEPEPQGDPRVEVHIEIPRGSFVKRGSRGQLDFVSPFPCPFNYGAIRSLVGGDGDLLDAVVLGPRLAAGRVVVVEARAAICFTDRDIYDDKLICSAQPLRPLERRLVLLFFHFYAFCKRWLNRYRRLPGRTTCDGWCDARDAIARARPRTEVDWQGPDVPF